MVNLMTDDPHKLDKSGFNSDSEIHPPPEVKKIKLFISNETVFTLRKNLKPKLSL